MEPTEQALPPTPRDELPDLWRLAVGGALALLLAGAAAGVLWLIARPLVLLFAAIVLASAMAAPAGWLTRWMPRPAAVVLAYAAVGAVAAGMLWYVVDRLVAGAGGLMATFPTALERLREMLRGLDPDLGRQAERALETGLDAAAAGSTELPKMLAAGLFETVLIVVFSAYWLLAAPAMRTLVLSLVPRARREMIDEILREMDATMGGYVRATAIDSAVVGVIVYLGLLVLGIPFALPLALVAFVGELVPLVGPYIAAVPILAVAVLQSPFDAAAVAVLLLVVKQAESYFLLPMLLRNESRIPQLLAVFALVAGTAAGGLMGAIVGVPLAGAARVAFVRLVVPALRRRAET